MNDSDPFAFFHETVQSPIPKSQEDRYAELLKISKSPDLLKQAMLDDPDILWKNVRPEQTMPCSCMWEDYLSRTVMQAAIDNKTVTEAMLREVGREVLLDWEKICRMVPLSVSALEEYQDHVDWDSISGRYLYPITYDIIDKVGHKVNWSQVNLYDLKSVSQEDFEHFVFENQKIPLEWACDQQAFERPSQFQHLFLPEHLLEQSIDELVKAQLLPKLLRKNFDMFDRLYQKYGDETWFAQLAACADFITQIGTHIEKLQRYLTPFKMSQTYRDKGWNPLLPFLSEQQFRTLVLPEKSKFSWSCVSSRKNMSDAFLTEFADQLHWNVVTRFTKLSRDNLRLFANRLDLKVIARYQRLPEDIIHHFALHLDWDDLCWHQQLSEGLIEAHLSKLNWGNISSKQALSKEFVKKYRNRLNFIKLKQNSQITFDLSEI